MLLLKFDYIFKCLFYVFYILKIQVWLYYTFYFWKRPQPINFIILQIVIYLHYDSGTENIVKQKWPAPFPN